MIKRRSRDNICGTLLTMEQINYTLNDAIQNEEDRSIAVLIGLGIISGLRRGEICGLKFGNIDHGELMDFSVDNMKEIKCDIEYYKEHDELIFIDNNMIYNGRNMEMPIKSGNSRIVVKPKCLSDIISYMMEQRNYVLKKYGKEIKSSDYVYMPLRYVGRKEHFPCDKVNKIWREYQIRRNKRMEDAGLEGIPIISIYELRANQIMQCRALSKVDELLNYGKRMILLNGITTESDWIRTNRDNIINHFDDKILIDWTNAMKL